MELDRVLVRVLAHNATVDQTYVKLPTLAEALLPHLLDELHEHPDLLKKLAAAMAAACDTEPPEVK